MVRKFAKCLAGRHVALSFHMFKNTLDMKANIHFGTLRDTDVVKFDDDIPCLDLARSRSSAEKSDGDLLGRRSVLNVGTLPKTLRNKFLHREFTSHTGTG